MRFAPGHPVGRTEDIPFLSLRARASITYAIGGLLVGWARPTSPRVVGRAHPTKSGPRHAGRNRPKELIGPGVSGRSGQLAERLHHVGRAVELIAGESPE